MDLARLIVGLGGGFGFVWYGMVSWNENGLDVPDFLSDGAYILLCTNYTVSK